MSITTSALPAGQVGKRYGLTLRTAGGRFPYKWVITSGSLPAGLKLSTSGRISGIPTLSGSSSVTVQVTDGKGATASRGYTLVVSGKILYQRGGRLDKLVVMNADGTGQKLLTPATASDEHAAWSPDGSKIAFTSSKALGNKGIFVMTASGRKRVNLSKPVDQYDQFPAWSPDGSKIAFGRQEFEGGVGTTYAIWSMNADGSGQTMLATADSGASTGVFAGGPRWSPDGSKIAFTRGGEVFVMNADGTGLTNLTNASGRQEGPVWSPDGSKIAFTSSHGSWLNDEIYVMNADGSGQTRLTNDSLRDTDYVWSPDGSKLLFTKGSFVCSGPGCPPNDIEIYVMNADGSGQTRLTDNDYSDSQPNWSADGSKIVFVSGPNLTSEIYVMNADGSAKTALTKNKSQRNKYPEWSP
ncbi:putative Ig domain-containing protein [Nocardioides silvaticus]|uniref:putative Ig domain-containing protein n=1 Tax=Nocardioides silvaticus TaxID=2201891 RepID=UPI001304F6C9|nr:putative Ig domain-containing protein [Nocardioides silvaticus]